MLVVCVLSLNSLAPNLIAFLFRPYLIDPYWTGITSSVNFIARYQHEKIESKKFGGWKGNGLRLIYILGNIGPGLFRLYLSHFLFIVDGTCRTDGAFPTSSATSMAQYWVSLRLKVSLRMLNDNKDKRKKILSLSYFFVSYYWSSNIFLSQLTSFFVRLALTMVCALDTLRENINLWQKSIPYLIA